MNRNTSIERIFNITVVLIASFAVSMVACSGQEITRADLIQGPTHCGHVISLIDRHGVNQTFDSTVGQINHHHSAFGSMMIPAAEMGDLQIVSVHQINHGDLACGPKIAVVIANHSSRCVENFHVTAVATLGRVHPHSPNQTVCAGKIQPNEALQVELTLPIESLAMGNRAGQMFGFQRLVIAIDSFDELAETDEANNIQALAVASIPFMDPTVVSTVQSTTTIQSQELPDQQANAAVQSTNESPNINSTSVPTNQDPLQAAINQLDIAATTNGS